MKNFLLALILIVGANILYFSNSKADEDFSSLDNQASSSTDDSESFATEPSSSHTMDDEMNLAPAEETNSEEQDSMVENNDSAEMHSVEPDTVEQDPPVTFEEVEPFYESDF